MQLVGGAKRRAMQALGAGDIHIGFVDGGHFHLRRKPFQDGVDAARIIAVALRVTIHENGLRAQTVGGAQRHGGVDAEFSGGVGGGGDNSALVRSGRRPQRVCL